MGQFDFQVTREDEVAGVPTVTSEPLGTIEFVLHDDIVPKTTRNFRELATGQHGYGYQGSKIFRIVSDGVVQGGDITENNGHGGRSIFPRNKFEGEDIRNDQCLNGVHLCVDENFDIKHTRAGQLTMANTGVNSNTSQFFITLGSCPWLNGTHVAFGMRKNGLTSQRWPLNYTLRRRGWYPQYAGFGQDCGLGLYPRQSQSKRLDYSTFWSGRRRVIFTKEVHDQKRIRYMNYRPAERELKYCCGH